MLLPAFTVENIDKHDVLIFGLWGTVHSYMKTTYVMIYIGQCHKCAVSGVKRVAWQPNLIFEKLYHLK